MVEIKDIIEDWKNSGLNKTEFCKTRSINIHTFNYWCQKIKKQNTTPGFIEIRPGADRISKQAIRLTYPNGVCIDLPSNAGLSLIASLINLH